MTWRILALIICAMFVNFRALASDATGRFIEYEHVAAKGLPEQRLTIWLPPGYDASDRHYPVIYMHDGHNLFDPAKSNFNKVWAADKAVGDLANAGTIEPHIIVGIWAPGSARYRQYLPRSAHLAADPRLRGAMDALANGPVISDAYLGWIAGDLKAWVDGSFRTRPGRDDTAIAGSSMGGLMSCYAFLERPQVFGRAACVSSHWPAVDPQLLDGTDRGIVELWRRWFAGRLRAADGRRLWMDHGTATLDAHYGPYQQAIDESVEAAGWRRGVDFESRVYEGAEHDENAWARRLPELLAWLLGRRGTE
jgi:predicted alpha/beta superfamily hydrolase